MYDLYCEFDLQKHKETYVNYFEVIMHPSGKIEYAIPSHQEKLVHIGMTKYNKSRHEFEMMCPPEYYADYLTWLCMVTGCVAFWTDGHIGEMNHIQEHVYKNLIQNGLTK